MDDDTDEKVRRNVVVLSTLILVAAWLDIRVTAVFEKLLGTPIARDIDPRKLWFAVFVLLIYFVLRYRWSKLFVESAAALSAEWMSIRQARIGASLEAALGRYTRFGLGSRLFTSLLRGEMEGIGKGMGIEDPRRNRPRMTIGTPQESGDPYQGRVPVTFEWSEPGRSSSGQLYDYKFSGRRKAWAVVRAASVLLFYSRSSIYFLLPLALAFAASFVVIERFFRAVHAAAA